MSTRMARRRPTVHLQYLIIQYSWHTVSRQDWFKCESCGIETKSGWRCGGGQWLWSTASRFLFLLLLHSFSLQTLQLLPFAREIFGSCLEWRFCAESLACQWKWCDFSLSSILRVQFFRWVRFGLTAWGWCLNKITKHMNKSIFSPERPSHQPF